MSDIVERLRSTEFASATDGLRSPVIWVKGTVAREAADEIEKLRAALRDIARQPEGNEESAQAVARAALGEKE
jgi:hypothetical protein